MSRVIKRGATGAAKEKAGKKKDETDSDDDSEALQEQLQAEADQREWKKVQKQAVSIRALIEEQKAKNAQQLKKLAQRRNEYPVMLYINFTFSFTDSVLCCRPLNLRLLRLRLQHLSRMQSRQVPRFLPTRLITSGVMLQCKPLTLPWSRG